MDVCELLKHCDTTKLWDIVHEIDDELADLGEQAIARRDRAADLRQRRKTIRELAVELEDMKKHAR